MDQNAIIEQLTEVMGEVFDLDELEYDESMSAADIEEWDSLSNIRFVVAVEKEFGIRFSNSEIEAIENVGQLTALISSKLG